MSDTLTSNEISTSGSKIKAIYPHIVVTGSPLHPCYSIEWYDVERGEMIHGYSSYSLPFVYKWLQEEFEVIDNDIEHFINTKNDEIKALLHSVKSLSGHLSSARIEAIKKFAGELKERKQNVFGCYYVSIEDIDNRVKEWESDTE